MNEILLFDGGFGTYLASKNPDAGLPEMSNLTARETVAEIHREYIAAGANAIKTNTFSANSAYFADRERLRAVIEAGWSIACEAAKGSGVRVFADIGPIGSDFAAPEYCAIADIFMQLGATDFLFETQNEAGILTSAVKRIKSRLPDSRVIVSFAVRQDGYTKTGGYYRDLFAQAAAYGADTVGLNCVCGPVHALNLLSVIPTGSYDLAAMPNAGYPSVINNRTVYIDNPRYFADKLALIHAAGVNTLGGCCGTTPEHIARLAKLLKEPVEKRVTVAQAADRKEKPVESGFKKGFIAVEIAAPTDASAEYMLEAAEKAKSAGADFVTIPDSPLGRTHANSFAMCELIQRTAGIDAIAHLCCRDKNQIAIKGDLIAGSICGVRRVLAITGDAIAETERVENKNVFSFNSFKLINFIRSLNEVTFSDAPYTICAALNTSARNFGQEIKRAREKLDNGAEYLFTQPFFSHGNIENYREAKAALNCKIAIGIMPLAGYKNAVFLNNEVPGINIPPEIIASLEAASPTDSKKICRAYAESLLTEAGFDCDGYYLMPTLKKIDTAIGLVKFILRHRDVK